MGHGIAELLAMTGYEVTIIDISEEFLQKGKEKIRWSLDKLVEKKRIRREDADATLARVKTTTNYEQAAKDIDLAIEAVPEDMELKKKCLPHSILWHRLTQC